MKQIRWLVLGLSFLSTLVSPLYTNAGQESPFSMLKIRKLVIAYPEDSSPFFFTDQQGEARGLVIDLWQLWAQKTGVVIEFWPGTWQETLEMIRQGQADVHAGLIYSQERDNYLDFTAPITHTELGIFFHKNILGIRDLQDLRGFKIGVITGSYAEEYLRKHLPQAILARYASFSELLDAAQHEEIRVFVRSIENTLWWLKQREILDEFRYVPQPQLAHQTISAAVPEGRFDLTGLIIRGMNQISVDERAALEQQWIGFASVKTRETLTVAIHNELPPFTFINAEGEPAGMFVDLWRLWAQKIDQAIQFRPTSWKDTLSSLRKGDADIHAGLFPNEEREQWLDFSQPFYEVEAKVFFLTTSDPPGSLAEFVGQKVGAVSGTYHEQYLRQHYPDLQVESFPSTEDLIYATKYGRIRAFLAVPHLTSILLNQLGLSGVFQSINEPGGTERFRAGILRGNQDLLSLIDKGLNNISTRELITIEARWITDPNLRYYQFHPQEIRLTTSEEDWLRKHHTIRLSAERENPPLSYLDQDGNFQGMFADYARLISERTGLRIDPLLFPVDQMVEYAKNKTIDVFCGVETPERQTYMLFTGPFLALPLVIINRQETPFITDLSDLNGKTIAVVKRGALHEQLLRDYPDIQISLTENDLQALKLVSLGQADAYIGTLVGASYLIRVNKITNLKIAAPSGYPDIQLRYAVRDDWPELVSILDKVIDSMTQQEHAAVFQKWVAIRYEHAIDWQLVWFWFGIIGGIVGIILGLTLFWNRRLTREVTERRRTEEEMAHLRNILGYIVNSMPSILIGINRTCQITQWNREAEKYTGIPLKDAIGCPLVDLLPQLQSIHDTIQQVMQKFQPHKVEKMVWKDGEKMLYFDIIVYPLITDELEGAVIRVDDVTERVHLEEMMIQTEKMTSLGGLAAGMAHEINNPLGIILQSIQNTLRRFSADHAKNREAALRCGIDLERLNMYLEQRNILQYLNGMREAALRASKIVKNMLSFSRPGPSSKTVTDLHQLLDATIELAANDYDLSKKYDFRHIEIIRQYDPALPEIPCVITEIEQVFLNLLKNAAQAIAERRDPEYLPHILITTSQEDRWAVVSIEDNGIGIVDPSRKHLFEPFYTTKTVGDGTGLGLSVSYFIITNNHQGKISVDSEVGKGTTFTIHLPLGEP